MYIYYMIKYMYNNTSIDTFILVIILICIDTYNYMYIYPYNYISV